jgi:predicted nucleotidyltransferase
MLKTGVESVVRTLNEHQVQYLIVGGLAVVAHGYVRFTADVDVVLSLDPDNIRRAISAFQTLGYRPRAPVAFEQFLDPANRQQWKREKNMTVFSLFSPAYPATEIDLFVEAPLDFSSAYARAVSIEVAPGTPATFCGLDDLIALKSKAGRPQDMEDIRRLRQLGKNG